MKKISRRNFLSICGAMAAVGAMTACGGSSSGSSTAASSTGSAAASAAERVMAARGAADAVDPVLAQELFPLKRAPRRGGLQHFTRIIAAADASAVQPKRREKLLCAPYRA